MPFLLQFSLPAELRHEHLEPLSDLATYVVVVSVTVDRRRANAWGQFLFGGSIAFLVLRRRAMLRINLTRIGKPRAAVRNRYTRAFSSGGVRCCRRSAIVLLDTRPRFSRWNAVVQGGLHYAEKGALSAVVRICCTRCRLTGAIKQTNARVK